MWFAHSANGQSGKTLSNHEFFLRLSKKLIAAIDEITAAADVAKGTFYTHFSDKGDLERALAGAVRAELEAEVDRTNDGIDEAGVRMANGLATFLSFAVRQPTRARTLLRMMSSGADPESPINAGIRADVVLGVNRSRSMPQFGLLMIIVVQGSLNVHGGLDWTLFPQ